MPPFISDFIKGAISVIAVRALFAIWQMVQYPSLETIDKRNRKSLPPLGDDDKITVWGFDKMGCHHHWNDGISDASVFVSRVEAYLRLIGQPYEKLVTVRLSENPRGKVPFANVNGTMVDDSAVIIELIKSTKQPAIDDELTDEQKTQGYLIQQLLMGSLYWNLLLHAFNSEVGREHFWNEMRSAGVPALLVRLICASVFKQINANLQGQGIGKQNPTVVAKEGEAHVRVLSKILGDNEFILGSPKPTSYDADVYAFVVLLFYHNVQLASPWVQDVKKECVNLIEYCERMKKILYPELVN